MTRGVLFWFLPILFLSCYSIYLSTLGPAFQPDDSAETIAACVTLTPQHPSGYPLCSFIGRSFSLLPVGNPALRLNLLAAGLSSILVTLVGLYLFRMFRSFWPGKAGPGSLPELLAAYGGAMVLALSKTYWQQSLTAKGSIYILQALVLLGILHCLEKKEEGSKPSHPSKALLLLGFIVGLGFANGWEMQGLFTAALILYVISAGDIGSSRSKIEPKKLILSGSFAVMGISPYLLLPLRGSVPFLSLAWGETSKFSGFARFLSNLEVRQEVVLKIWSMIRHPWSGNGDWPGSFRQLSALGPQLDRISRHLLFDLGLWSWIPLILGFLFLRRSRNSPVLILGLLVSFLLILANGFIFLTPWENLWCVDKFLIPANLFGVLCVGLGIRQGALELESHPNFKGPLHRRNFMTTVLFLSLIFPVYSLFAHWRSCDQSRQTWDYDQGGDILRSLQRDSVFVAEGDDPVFSVQYFQQVLGLRKDVALVPAYYLWAPWGGKRVEEKLPDMKWDQTRFGSLSGGEKVNYAMTRILDRETQGRPVQVSANLDLLDRCFFSLQPAVRSTGDLFSLLTPLGFSLVYGKVSAEKSFEFLDRPRERGSVQDRTSSGGAMDSLFNLRSQSYFNAAEYCSRKGLVDRADRYFSSAIEEARAPTLQARIWMGRGDLFFSQKKAALALSAYQNSAALAPDPASCSRLVRSLLALRKYPEALAEARRSTELYSGDEGSWRSLAACEAAMGNGEKERQAFQRAVELGGR